MPEFTALSHWENILSITVGPASSLLHVFHSAKSRTNNLQQAEQMGTQLPWAMDMLWTIFNI